MFTSLLLALSSLIAISTAQAAVSPLESQVLEAQKICPKLNCPDSSVLLVTMTSTEMKKLGKDVREQMKMLVVEFARDQWPDTILEGPFEHANRFKIEKLQKLLIDDEHVGYRITYSDKAWDLDSCEYAPDKPESLKECKTGRIVESAFVDLALTLIFRDEHALADYVSDEKSVRR
jgi:hypothetical protein